MLGWIAGCDVQQAALDLDAGWVLIEGRFPYYNDRAPGVYGALNVQEPWKDLRYQPWLDLVFSQGSSDLYRIRNVRSQ